MKRKNWIIISVITLIIILVGTNVIRTLSKETPEVKTATAGEREITGSIMIPGTLSLKEEKFIYLDPEKGKIAEILVKEGDKVEKGSALLRYDNEQLQLEKKQNALSLESSYLRINQIKNQLNDLEEKEEDLEKQIGEKEAEKQIESERNQLNIDLKMADIEARQILLQKETIEKKLGELEVKSESSGSVITINSDALTTQSQNPIIHVGKINEFVVKGTISEYDSLKIKEKQSVTLKSDVIPDKTWKGAVESVSLLPEQSNSVMGNEDQAVQYPIEVNLQDKKIEAKPGFKLIMEIETEKRKALTIPLEAVKQDGEIQFVYIVEDGKAIHKEVEMGTASGDFIEVKKGLNKGDSVIVNPSKNLVNNMEVTVE
ncbi:efflux RND transporter periplasmic adaptor subunit [Metabacillus litoralis]|uniref:efflux RND transporter periplasmic adaptor subunit n=1 Tax=Metabacillus litoralis TaxID=152268 RepID=UPI001CFD6846|nr:efflux RND transporter periplasmic adaptor subunit [Metabacillus litoralis]